MNSASETYVDHLVGFSLPARDTRGRAVRLDGVLSDILNAHDYPAPIKHLLAESLVLTALSGGLLKEETAQLTMQAQTQDGPVSLLVCDYRAGDLRGYAEFDQNRLTSLGVNPSLGALFGTGYLAITFETGQGKRYQGIVPLEGASLSEAFERYFMQSEQIPTLLRVGIRVRGDSCVAGGLLLQYLPKAEEGGARLHVQRENPDWEHVSILASSLSHEELVAHDLSLEAILWRLFHEEDEIRVEQSLPLAKGCRCNTQHYNDVIRKFPVEEQDAMRNDEGLIVVDCAFCSREFALEI